MLIPKWVYLGLNICIGFIQWNDPRIKMNRTQFGSGGHCFRPEKYGKVKSLCKYKCGFRQTAMLSSADSTLTLDSKFVMKHNEVVASGLQFTRREDNCCAAFTSVYVFIISSCHNFPFYAV